MSERPSSPMRLIGRIGAKRIQEVSVQDRSPRPARRRPNRAYVIGVRIVDDKRDFHRRLVEELFLTQPMVTEIVAVVRGEHDQRIVEQTALLKETKQHPHLIVDLFDQAHIDRDDLVAHLVASEAWLTRCAMNSRRHRVRIDAFALRAHWRDHLRSAVHVVVWRGGNVGPVRLDVGKVQAPRLLADLAMNSMARRVM